MVAESSGRSTRRRYAGLPAVLLAGAIAAVLLAPGFTPVDPNAIATAQRLRPPSLSAPLGTDQLGRDVLSRLLVGGRVALATGLVAVLGATVIALASGITAGLLGGVADRVIATALDLVLALPGLLVTLAILGVLGTDRLALVIALIGGSWAGEARIIRHLVTGMRTSPAVEAARAIGANRRRIATHHILPAMLPTALVLASLNLGQALLAISSLSFLGLGIQPPDADWGTLLAESRPYVARAPWLMIAPGLCLAGFATLANLAGDSLHALVDPRRRVW